MTYRERVIASIKRSSMDALPWQFDLTTAVIEKLKLYLHTDDVHAALEDHIVSVGQQRPPQAPPLPPVEGVEPDEFGVAWRTHPDDLKVGDCGRIISPLKEPSLGGYDFPDGSAPGRWDHLQEIRANRPSHFLLAHGPGLFEPGWALCGFENYLGYLLSEPKFVEELTEKLADYSCQVIEQLEGKGVDGIRFGDDWGFQDRLMMQKVTWRRFFKEQYRRIYGAAHKLGLIVMIHSCGNITELLPEVIDVGVEVVHPLQPEAMDVEYCQREFGQDLSFWGGLGSQSTIPLGTPEDNAKEAFHRLHLFKQGGYILACAGAAPADTPAENIAAIAQVAKGQLRKD